MDGKLILEKAKKTLKFVWRHFFTLAILAILFSVLIEAPLNWENAFFMVATSFFLDWAKQFIKAHPYCVRCSPHLTHQDDGPLHIRQWWNSDICGSATNLMNSSGIKWDR